LKFKFWILKRARHVTSIYGRSRDVQFSALACYSFSPQPTLSESRMSAAEPRRNPSRAARPTNFKDGWWYPESTVAHSDVDRQIQTLNKEAYPADLFGRADDLLMFSLFATKQATHGKRKRPRKRHHAVIPQQVTNQPMLTRDEGATAAKICESLLSGNDASMDEVCSVVSELEKQIPLFRSPERLWLPCLQQCAEFLFFFLLV
jgi:hypothetical protein